MNALAVLGLVWLLGTGILVPLLAARRGEKQDRLPTRFEHLRATSTYAGRGTQRMARPEIVFRSMPATPVRKTA